VHKTPHSPPARATRLIVGALLAMALFFNTVGTLFAAGTTGTINGHITDSRTNAAIAGVTISAVSPTGSYRATTDNNGFFAIAGVQPDTYTISFQKQGFQPLSTQGVTVSADQNSDATTRLTSVSLRTIARVTTRSEGSAYQPKQTQDTYTVTTAQVQQLLGKTDAISETQLLTRLPGASLDRYGYPVLRGGRENEEGFQFDGIPYVDAFTSQFTNSLALNAGLNQLQLTPGAGDASTGNAGTGTINLIAKRGTYPAFGSLDAEALLQPYTHQLAVEYGTATPNGAISNYIQFTGYDSDSQLGARKGNVQSLSIGSFYNPYHQASRSFSDNLVFKFGKNRAQSFQIFYDNQQTNFTGAEGSNTLTYPAGDPYYLAEFGAFTDIFGNGTGLNQAQLQSPSLISLLPNQTSLTARLGASGGTNYYQPNNVLKFQYAANLGPASFLTAKYYSLDSVVDFHFPSDAASINFASFDTLQGGHRSGSTIDFTTQVNAQNLVAAGLEYDFLHPVYQQVDPFDGVLDTAAVGIGSGYETADFINPALPADGLGNCPLGTDPNGASYCGYLYRFAKSPGPIPYAAEQSVTNRQDYAFYVRDKFTPNERVNIDAGVRIEGTNNQLPGLEGCNPATAAAALIDTCQYNPTSFHTVGGTSLPQVAIPNDAKHPLEVEPRFAVSFQLARNDAVRLSFARSTEFAPLAFVDLSTPTGIYSRYAGIPSYDVLSNLNAGAAATPPAPGCFSGACNPYQAMFCGVQHKLPCQNYADQLRWENQALLGVPIQPVRPETFTNYEFSYSHQFPAGIGMKITPFYRRGYDALALVSQPLTGANGQPLINPTSGNILLGPSLATNLGVNRTTGVELYFSREVPYGLSGSISATYINELSNVVPSPLIQEDFFPPIPTQSLLLGNQYRVGFVSPLSGTLALSYKMHNGVRINPIVTYTRGYPAGVGNITAAFVNGKPYNVANTNTGIASAFGSNFSPNFIDPQNPGSVFNPNIAATRGTPETASAGGFITNPRVNTNVSVEYSPPGSRSTFGVLITNLFNQLYSGVPTYNSRYQAVATGIAGPKTGYSTLPVNFPEIGSQQYLPFQYGNDPYRIVPSLTPQTVRLYYQLTL